MIRQPSSAIVAGPLGSGKSELVVGGTMVTVPERVSSQTQNRGECV